MLVHSGAAPETTGTELRDLRGRCNCRFRAVKGVRPETHRVPSNTEGDQPSSLREGHKDCGEEGDICMHD